MKSLPEALPPTFTTRVARQLGVHSRDLYAWRDAEEVVELSRGVFRRGDAPAASYPDVLAVAHRAPAAIVCCVAAASVHGLTDELVGQVQVAVPKGGYVPVIDYPPTVALRFDASSFELGLSHVEAARGEPVRIYDAARTVVDLVRLRSRFGEPVAHSALRRYLELREARPALLLEYAQKLGGFNHLRAALDVVSAR